jgi:hypothetical protein
MKARLTAGLGAYDRRPFEWKRLIGIAAAACMLLAMTGVSALWLTGRNDGFVPGGEPGEKEPPVAELIAVHTAPYRVDLGGNRVLALMGREEYEAYESRQIFLRKVYCLCCSAGDQFTFDAETADILREFLRGKLFTGDGEPFETSFVPADGEEGLYRFDDKGLTLYYWHEGPYEKVRTAVTEIRYLVTGSGNIEGVHISNRAPEEESFPDTYQAAAAALGQDFRLPTVYTEGLEPPGFRIQDHGRDYGGFANVIVSIGGDPGMWIVVEPMRKTDDNLIESYAYGTAEVYQFGETTVYKIIDAWANRYTWAYGGLIYTFNQNPCGSVSSFTDNQVFEIIGSMTETPAADEPAVILENLEILTALLNSEFECNDKGQLEKKRWYNEDGSLWFWASYD